MRNFLRGNARDAAALGVAVLLYLAVVIIWSLVLDIPDDGVTSLTLQKDVVYYTSWALAGLYAALGTLLTLRDVPAPRRERRRQYRMALVALWLPMVLGLGAEIVNQYVLLPILPGIVHPAMQLVIAGLIIVLSVFFGVRGAALPGQVVTRAYIRFGLGLMLIPTIGFVVHMPLTGDWSGPVRGVVLGNAMLHGIIWGVLYSGLLGANMLARPAVARAAGRH